MLEEGTCQTTKVRKEPFDLTRAVHARKKHVTSILQYNEIPHLTVDNYAKCGILRDVKRRLHSFEVKAIHFTSKSRNASI